MSTSTFPREFGKYVLLRPFARGGMGELFVAASGEMSGAEKLCLIKKVPEDRDSPGLTARLLDEAKVAVRLNHMNLVQVFDAGRVDEELYIAMELIEGRDLRAVWNRTAERRSRIPLDVALYLVREMARGLDYAHNYGGLNLVHRDIAPPNVIISFHGEVKITDFGLARSILKNERTAPGIVYGRVAYLAPEQARGEQADPRTDIFATGVILWELLTGRPLHDTSDDAVKNLERARHPRVEAPSHITRGLPPTIDQVALKALAPDRANRYQRAEDFRKALADELGRIAPGTDSTRVAAFLKDLFGDEIKQEAAERERLLREDLPKLKAQRLPAKTPPRGVEELDPPTRSLRTPTHPSLPPEDDLPPRLPPRRPSAVARPGPAAVPPLRSSGAAGGRPLTAPPPLPGARPPTPPPLPGRQRPSGIDQFDLSDEELTRTAAPRGRPASVMATRAAVPARGPAPAAAPEKVLDPDEPEVANLVGEVIDGRYRVLRLLGTGGMGAVYEAEHVEIGKKVALKVLHPQYSRQADLVARFRREARAASKVGHPNIVDVTDSGTTDNDDVYFVMERLDGLDLGEVLRHERRVAPDRAVHIGTQICRALSAAHAAGIIHRDLKPENIFLVSRDGNADFVKVLDFGIAKHDMGNQNLPRRLTTPGIAMGTPEYMAPEQAAGKAIDGRVDIYSVGAILYEMLTGEPPHSGGNVMEILSRKATEPPTPPRVLNPDLPEALEQVVMTCLERDPARRPQTMGALEYELNKSLKGRGSAVAAVLGLKPPADPEATTVWDEPSKVRKSESGLRPSSPGFVAPGTPFPTGQTGAMPLDATGDVVRVAGAANRKINSREAVAPTVPLDEKNNPEFKAARRASRGAPAWGVLLGLALVGGSGYLLWRYQPWKGAPSELGVPVPAPATTTQSANVEPPPEEPPPPKRAPREPDDEKMSTAEIDRMLEWARRTAEGGRIIAPPGDNLKELLDRIEKAEPGNASAQQLRARTVQILSRKGALALKRNRIDEAVQDFESLAALKPDDERIRTQYARALRLRAERMLERHKVNAALSDITASLELDPDDTTARIVLADVYLAQNKPNDAAEEYQKILDGKPADKRARRGLMQAQQLKNRPPPKPAPKKKKK